MLRAATLVRLWMAARARRAGEAGWAHDQARRLERPRPAYLEIFGTHPDLSVPCDNLANVRHNITTYGADDRPDVEVLTNEGEWVPGELRLRWQDEQGAWWANVAWRPADTHTRRLDNFRAERVRTV